VSPANSAITRSRTRQGHHQFDRAVNDFEEAWEAGKRPTIEDYLQGAGMERAALLLELVHVDLERRLKAGELAHVEDYILRFPALVRERQQILGLITLEYEQRCREDDASAVAADLQARFPGYRQELVKNFGEAECQVLNPCKAETEIRVETAGSSSANDGPLAELVQFLRDGPFLKKSQLEQITRETARRCQKPEDLLAELVKRDWLTAYQAKEIEQGRGRSLLLGAYVLLEPLGAGGMGQVYKARHFMMNRTCAVKLILSEQHQDVDIVQRFYREVKAIAQMAHPNIVAAYDAGQVRSLLYLVMEYIDGTDLDRLVSENGRLPIAKACEYIRQAALGLQHAHERGLVHRDIKPSNLIVTTKGGVSSLKGQEIVKILDLGLARLCGPQGDDGSRLTQLGAAFGTPDYMAPEQWRDVRQADIRSDIYSLGCTLYELLTGNVPFPTEQLLQKSSSHQHEEPLRLEDIRPEVPGALAVIVRRMMAKNKSDRYQTPGEVAMALAELEIIAPSPTPSIPTEPKPSDTEVSRSSIHVPDTIPSIPPVPQAASGKPTPEGIFRRLLIYLFW
jgi:serine/threonine protein kinase